MRRILSLFRTFWLAILIFVMFLLIIWLLFRIICLFCI
ncbi:hypothetical protein SZ39_4770 [Bacillus mycoides]|nr:hypothetical protein SZ39_4770 [Bacillus mycoides]